MKNVLIMNLFISLAFALLFACGQAQESSITANDTGGIVTGPPDSSLATADSIIESPATILEKDTFLTCIVDPKVQDLRLYWKDDQNNPLVTFTRLKEYLQAKNKKLVFAMNAGMYMTDYRPLGLYIENGKVLVPINKRSAPNANFYQKPNGVFYIDTNRVASVCKTDDFVYSKSIVYASQSGPMLLIDNEMHPVCKPGSLNTCNRNGVGILPDGKVLFVLAFDVSFYELASFFKEAGCSNALYFDGAISDAFFPEKNYDGYGGVGPMVGITTKL